MPGTQVSQPQGGGALSGCVVLSAKYLQLVMSCMALAGLLHPLGLHHHSSLALSLWRRNLQRTQMRNSTDQALMRAFREVNRIADRLNVTKAARDTAMDYYR